MDLRQKCAEFLSKLKMDSIMRQGSPVDDLMGFVLSEREACAKVALSRQFTHYCDSCCLSDEQLAEAKIKARTASAIAAVIRNQA